MAIKDKQVREFTFPDSGQTVYLPVVSLTAMAMKIQRRYPRPTPPLQEVDYGGRKGWEYNWADPDYALAVREYEAFVDARATELAIQQATRFKLNKEQQEELDEWKAENTDQWDDKLDRDHNLWLEEIGITTDKDFQEFMEFVTGPTEEVIASVQDGFQGKVQGAEPVDAADS